MIKNFLLFAAFASLGLLSVAPIHAQTAKPEATATPATVVASTPSAPNASATSVPTPATRTEPGEKQTAREHQPSAKKLEKYDTNKNGVIDPEERIAMKKDKLARHEERLKKYDKNGDGKLDDTEKAVMRADEKAEKKADKVQ